MIIQFSVDLRQTILLVFALCRFVDSCSKLLDVTDTGDVVDLDVLCCYTVKVRKPGDRCYQS